MAVVHAHGSSADYFRAHRGIAASLTPNDPHTPLWANSIQSNAYQQSNYASYNSAQSAKPHAAAVEKTGAQSVVSREGFGGGESRPINRSRRGKATETIIEDCGGLG